VYASSSAVAVSAAVGAASRSRQRGGPAAAVAIEQQLPRRPRHATAALHSLMVAAPATAAATRAAAALRQHVLALAAAQPPPRPDQLSSAFQRVSQLCAHHAEEASKARVLAAASQLLLSLEAPLQHQMGSLAAHELKAVFSAWARARRYSPPESLAAAAVQQLQRGLAAAAIPSTAQVAECEGAAASASRRSSGGRLAEIRSQGGSSTGGGGGGGSSGISSISSGSNISSSSSSSGGGGGGGDGSSGRDGGGGGSGVAGSGTTQKQAESGSAAGTVRLWHDVFVPFGHSSVSTAQSNSRSSSSHDPGTLSSDGVSRDDAVGGCGSVVPSVLETCEWQGGNPTGPTAPVTEASLSAAATAVVALSYIAEQSPGLSRQCTEWACSLAPRAVEVLNAALQHAEEGRSSNGDSGGGDGGDSGSTSCTGGGKRKSATSSSGQLSPREAPHAGDAEGQAQETASAPVRYAIGLLWGGSRLPPLKKVQQQLLLPLLQFMKPHAPLLGAAGLLHLLEALAAMEEGSRIAVAASGSRASRGSSAGGVIPVEDLLGAGSKDGQFLDDGWEWPAADAVLATGARHRTGAVRLGNGAVELPAPPRVVGISRGASASKMMLPAVHRAFNLLLPAATARLQALAPSMPAEQAVFALCALSRLSGPYQKLPDSRLGAAPHTLALQPVASLAAALARPGAPFPPQLVPFAMGAFARLMYAHDALFQHLAAEALAGGLDAFSPSQLAAMARACASLSCAPPGFMAALTAAAAPQLARFQPLQLAGLLWACAVLRHDDGELLAAAGSIAARWPLTQLPTTVTSQLLAVHNLYAVLHQRHGLYRIAPAMDALGLIGMAARSSGDGGGDRGDDGTGCDGNSSSGRPASPGCSGPTAGSAAPLGLPLFALPQSQLPALRAAVRGAHDAVRVSGFQAQVLATLRSSLRLRAFSEVELLDGALSVDILVNVRRALVVVEADGPWHYTRNVPGRHNGKSLLRHRLLTAAGYPVVSVNASDWVRLTSRQRAPYLLAALKSALKGGAAAEAPPH
jgi:hypothetical protein